MSSRQRHQHRNSRSSGSYYTQTTGYSLSSRGGYTQNTGYDESTVGQSTGFTSYGDYASQSYISRSGYSDPSYRSGYGDEYEEMYEDETSQYSSGSYGQQQSRQYEDMGEQSQGYTEYYEDSTIRSSKHESSSSRVSTVRRDDDAMSQQSYRSTASRSTAAFRSGAFSTTGSVGATTIADGGRGRCPYQIEFSVNNTGKQMSSSKRVISFRFGFADSKALMQGKAGVECRGEEHDVVVTWSITGGKRSIHVDGREIHFQAGKRGSTSTNPSRRADIFEAAWQMPDDHVCKLLCYAYKPAVGSPEKKDKQWRQYNLVIDGRCFFDLPEIFELGLKGLGPAKAMARELPPMVIEANETEMQGFIPPPSKHHRDEVAVKRDVQSRILAQRNLLKSRQKSQSSKSSDSNRSRQSLAKDPSSHHSVSSMGSHHSGYTSNSNLIDMTEGLNLSDNDRTVNISSNAPSELNEARQRQEHHSGMQMIPEAGAFEQKQLTRAALPAPQNKMAHQSSSLVMQQNYSQHQLQLQQQAWNSQQVANPFQHTQQQHLSNATGKVVPTTRNGEISPLTMNTYVPRRQHSLHNSHAQQQPVASNPSNAVDGASNNLVCPQPPSIDAIRNSMSNSEQETIARSTVHKFGYY